MNEEQMRKEFEEWCKQQWFVNLETVNDFYISTKTNILWDAWKASRQAMKPIKLQTKMKNTQSAECHCYNAAIEECKEAIKQAGHEVEE